MDAYIDILKQAIIENTKELEENADNYSMSQLFFMKGYTQSLKDVLVDLEENDLEDRSKFYTLRKFNLN
jgi:hypothetical protein